MTSPTGQPATPGSITSSQVAATTATSGTPPKYDLATDPRITPLTDDQVKQLSSTLTELIARRIDGINYAETRRAQIAAVGGAIAAIGVAVLPLGLGSASLPAEAACISFSICALIVGAVVWTIYALQTNYNYPFKNQLGVWKWFYHQALPDKSKFGPGIFRNRGSKWRNAEAKAYTDQWTKFTAQVGGLADLRVNATQDLKQLYQLHINERYKNLFLTRLRNICAAGLVLSIAIAICAFFIVLMIAKAPPTGSVYSGHELTTISSWTTTGYVRESGISKRDIEYRLNVTIENHANAPAVAGDLVAVDGLSQPIPAEFSVTPTGQATVAPGKKMQLSGHFWIAAEDRDQLTKIYSK